MAKINTHFLIEEVKKRPALWDRNCDEYANPQNRETCWKEIAPLFNTKKRMNVKEIETLVLVLKRKWKAVRGSYTREIIRQRAGHSPSGMIKQHRKKEYRYFKKLNFLESVVIPNRQGYIEKIEPADEIINTENSPIRTTEDINIEREADYENNFLKKVSSELRKVPDHEKEAIKEEILSVLENATRNAVQKTGLIDLLKRILSYPFGLRK